MARSILVIDDEDNMRWVLERSLKKAGYAVLTASRGEEGLQKFALNPVDLVLLDLKMPGMDGLAVLREIRQRSEHVPVLLLTAYATVPTAVEAMQVGATDYLRKPFDLETVLAKVNERLAQQADAVAGEQTVQARPATFDEFVGAAPTLTRPLNQAQAATEAPYTVVVTGEPGSSRCHLAALIHHNTRATQTGRLVVLDCSALPVAVLRRELPGPGEADGGGRWQEALGGSLLLSNVDCLPEALCPDLIPPLSQHLRNRQRPHGLRLLLTATESLPAVWDPLTETALHIQLPPLREHREDVRLLVAHFAPDVQWSQEALARLEQYPWPGNVAELQRVASQAARASGAGPVQPAHLPAHVRSVPPAAGPFHLPPEGIDLEEVERGLIRQALDLSEGNKTRAARLLGLTRATLLYRLDKYGIEG